MTDITLPREPTHEIMGCITRAIRAEIVRQHRDDDRGRCPAGSHFYEQHIGPYYIAGAAYAALVEHLSAFQKKGLEHMNDEPRGPTPEGTDDAPMPQASLEARLREAINHVSAENGSDTPDFILAQFLLGCLNCFDGAVRRREDWYGRTPAQMQHRPTIAELEAILSDPTERKVNIRPDGSIEVSDR